MKIKVHVTANARREKLEKLDETSFSISVREKAKGNAANHRVRELVAMHFKVPAKAVRIVNGHRAPSKLLNVRLGGAPLG